MRLVTLKHMYPVVALRNNSAKVYRLATNSKRPALKIGRQYRLCLLAATTAALASCSNQDTFTPVAGTSPAAASKVPETNVPVDKNKILEGHNFFRQQLGLPPLRWSTQLESLAAGWANYLAGEAGCTLRRRGSIGLPAHKNGIGENLQFHESVRRADGSTDVAVIDEGDVVLGWTQQGVDYNYRENQCAPDKVCENFTQVVWRDTQVVGCAAASCPGKQQVWVCNYDPPGNYFNQKPY